MLSELAEKIQKQKFIDKNLELPELTGLLLFMLYTREQPNID